VQYFIPSDIQHHMAGVEIAEKYHTSPPEGLLIVAQYHGDKAYVK